MSSLLNPAQNLMGRLSYARKFQLVYLLVMAPLIYLVVQLLVADFRALQTADRLQQRVGVLGEISGFIHRVEQMRDLAPIYALAGEHDQPRKRYQAARLEAMERFDAIGSDYKGSTALLTSIRQGLETEEPLTPGSEVYQIEQVFEQSQQLVRNAYEWRQLVASEAGMMAVADAELNELRAVFTDTIPRVREVAGRGRGYGAYFLYREFVDSSSVFIMDNTWERMESDIGQLRVEIQDKGNEASSFVRRLADGLGSIQGLFDAEVVQAFDLTTDWDVYFDQTSADIDSIHATETDLLEVLDARLQDNYQNMRHSLLLHGASLALILGGVAYLLGGFYRSVRLTITDLRDAARTVAQGEYDQAIQSGTRDELSQLAMSLDDMRIELKRREAVLRDFSLRDGLTGLRNRHFFDEALESGLRRARKQGSALSLLLVDLDYFKSVNDDYGHLAGDAALKQAASAFELVFRRDEDVVARYGGEEFTVLLVGVSAELVGKRAEQLRKKIEEMVVTVDDHRFSVTASIGGVTLVPDSATTPHGVIQIADSALYAAKDNGRNQVVHRCS